MTTEFGGSSAAGASTKSPKQAFYAQLNQALNDGGFDKHMAALCKPFIASAGGPSWWSSQPSSYFRALFVGYLEGIESEQELCWQLEESRLLRGFVGFDADVLTPDPATLAELRQPLLPLIHSEAFDSLLRIIDKTGLLEGHLPGLGRELLAADALVAILQRIQSRDHQNYWRRLTKMPGASWAPRSSVPVPPQSVAAKVDKVRGGAPEPATFALWTEDLSLARTAFEELRTRGITDFRGHFAAHDGAIVDHVVRACVYGRGPASVQAFLSATAGHSGRELPQQVTAETVEACKVIAVALAEGQRFCSVEAPLLDAAGQPALASIQLSVPPGYEDSLGSVLVSFTDITGRIAPSVAPQAGRPYVEEAIDHSRIGVWEWDVTQALTRWSDPMLHLYGISRAEFTGRYEDYLDYTYPEDREIQRESVRQSIADGVSQSHRPSADFSPVFRDYRIRRKDGQIRWVRGSAIEMVDEDGRPVKVQGVLWDITQTKQADLQLQENEQRFRHMVEQAALPIVVEAFDGEVIYANDSALAFFQIERDELSKLRATDYWQDLGQRAAATATLAENGEVRSFEARFRMGEGSEPRVMLMAASVIEYSGRNVILCHHQEITFSKCIEEQLRLAQQTAEEQLRLAQQTADEQLRLAQQTADEQLRELRQQFEEQSGKESQRVEKARQQADEQSQAIRQHLQDQLRQAQQQFEVAQQQHLEQQRVTQQQAGGTLAARVRELNLLKQIVSVSEQDPTRLVELVCRELAQTFELPMVLGALSTTDGSGLGIVAERLDTEQQSCLGKQLPLAQESLVGLFSEHPHPVWIGDASSDERAAPFRELVAFEPKAACLLLPLVVGEEIIGLLLLGTGAGRTLDADTLGLVGSVTTYVARTLTALGTNAACERLAATVERIRMALDGEESGPELSPPG